MFADDEKRRIMQQARAHAANRTEYLPRDVDAIATAWRTSKPTPEPDEKPLWYRTTETERRADHSRQWSDYVKSEIGNAIGAEHELLIETMGEVTANERANTDQLLAEQRLAIERLQNRVEVQTCWSRPRRGRAL
jgi:hypothetical protein